MNFQTDSQAWEGWLGLVPIESPVNNLSRETEMFDVRRLRRCMENNGKMVIELIELNFT